MAMPSVNEQTAAAGGLFVPDEWSAEVNQIIRDSGCVEGFARHLPMKREVLHIRKFATGVDGYWVDGMAVKTKDAPTFEKVTLTAEKIAVIVPFEDQLLQDADHDMAALVSTDVTGAFIERIDATLLGYDITTPFAQSVSGSTPIAHTVAVGDAGPDFVGDISSAISLIEGDGFQATGMIAHPRLKHYLRNLRDLQNQPIFTERLDACAPRERYCVFGVPICFTRMATPVSSPLGYEILIAQFDHVLVGDRSGMEVAVSNEATLSQGSEEDINLFEQDMTAYRFVRRLAFAIKDVNALAKVVGIPL